MKSNTIERESFKDASMELKNKLAIQYEPLMHKITHQMYGATGMNYDDLYSMAEEGFCDAINNYDPKVSNMKFTQYAAFSIRNKILTGVTTQKNAVSYNGYAITKMKKDGNSLYKTVSIDNPIKDKDENYNKESLLGICTMDKDIESPIDVMCNELSRKFSDYEIYLFKSFYGLGDTEQKSATELAKEQKVSIGSISQKTRKIVNYIKKNDDLKACLLDIQ